MRLRLVTLFVSCFAVGAVWACSLNPQPFPPDGYDASADALLTTSPDSGSGNLDATAGSNDGTVPSGGDAAVDASSDDSSASDASDAADDARDDDAALDAGEDG
jgi:hypothetical protein